MPNTPQKCPVCHLLLRCVILPPSRPPCLKLGQQACSNRGLKALGFLLQTEQDESWCVRDLTSTSPRQGREQRRSLHCGGGSSSPGGVGSQEVGALSCHDPLLWGGAPGVGLASSTQWDLLWNEVLMLSAWFIVYLQKSLISCNLYLHDLQKQCEIKMLFFPVDLPLFD